MTDATDGKLEVRLECIDASLLEEEREECVKQLHRGMLTSLMMRLGVLHRG